MSPEQQMREIINLPLSDFVSKLDALKHSVSKAELIKAVNCKNAYGVPMIHSAIAEGCVERFNLLIQYGAIKSRQQKQAVFHFSCSLNEVNPEILEFLLKKGADPNKRSAYFGTTYVQQRNRKENMDLLFKYGLNIHLFSEYTPFRDLILGLQRAYMAEHAKGLMLCDDSKANRPRL